MTEIRWKEIGTFLTGILFLFAFTGAVSGISRLDKREEKFLFIYQDGEEAEVLAKHGKDYGIACEMEGLNENHAGDTKQGSVLAVWETDVRKYENIEAYFWGHDGKIESEMMKWILQMGLYLFVTGIFVRFLLECKRNSKTSIGRLGVMVLVWGTFLGTVPMRFPFPYRVLPGRWSDFEGWSKLNGDVGKQFLTMLLYKENMDAGVYCEAVCGGLLWFLAAFLLFLVYHRCCIKTGIPFVIHMLLTIAGMGIYIRQGNPDLKAVICFFPCYAMTQYAAT